MDSRLSFTVILESSIIWHQAQVHKVKVDTELNKGSEHKVIRHGNYRNVRLEINAINSCAKDVCRKLNNKAQILK